MAEFLFPEITFGWPEKPGSGTYLWIWNADKVPPHLAISRGQNYFSLTYRSCEIQKSVAAMVRKAKRTRIPLVLTDISDWPFKYDFAAIFEQYERALPNGPTCLTPVKQALDADSGISQLSELLTEILNRGHLKMVFAVNLNDKYRGIPDYSVADIFSRIELLHETQRPESTLAPR